MTIPEFRDTSFLLAHAEGCLDFFSRAECVRSEEKGGGLYHCYRDDGSVYDTEIRHLVSSTRYVVQWAWALQRLPHKADKWRHFLDLSLRSLRRNHFEESTGRYVWQLSPLDTTNYCYGMAFALLAYSTAYRYGACEEALGYIERTWDVMTAELWEEDRGLYKDSMESAESYRGQNCVMHCLEAHLAAYEATRDKKRAGRGYCDGCIAGGRRCRRGLSTTGPCTTRFGRNSWQSLVDHRHETWYRLVSRDGTAHYDDLKSPREGGLSCDGDVLRCCRCHTTTPVCVGPNVVRDEQNKESKGVQVFKF